MRPRRRSVVLRSLAFFAVATTSVALSAPAAAASAPRVLRVGTYHGIPGRFSTIQAAVNAARPGDWILVGPGDYHERGSMKLDPLPAGVLITTPDVHLRGMNRNTVIVDGTKRNAPTPCDGAYKSQQYGPKQADGHWAGMDGVVAYRVSGVSIENLTVCNYLLTKHGGEGNEIWFNGGDGTGHIFMHSWHGAYLTATSTYSHGIKPPTGQYGLFLSNADGPGGFYNSYASNMGDAAIYIGACPNCNATLDHVHAQFSALGYSGTNSGGNLVIENSEWDHNKSGFVSNSQNNDDKPSPQDGKCFGKAKGPLKDGKCWIFENNYVHDNNDPNVPGAGQGLAGSSPIGSGIVLAGTRNDIVFHNRIEHNGSWGILVADLPDQETPKAGCRGGQVSANDVCYYGAWGNETANNTFKDNGFFGNPTNGDIGMATQPHNPGNCFHGNKDPKGLTSDPPNIQSPPFDSCSTPNGGDLGPLTAEALCATQLLTRCPQNPVAIYPRPKKALVKLHMPPPQPTMPNPCAGVPANPWCPGGGHRAARTVTGSVSASTTVSVLPRRRTRVSRP